MAVIDVDELTVNAAGTPPKVTRPTPPKSVPVIVTEVAVSAVLPEVVPRPVTVGADACVKVNNASVLEAARRARRRPRHSRPPWLPV